MLTFSSLFNTRACAHSTGLLPSFKHVNRRRLLAHGCIAMSDGASGANNSRVTQVRFYDLSVMCTVGRSMVSTVGRSMVRAVGRSMVRAVGRSMVRAVGRNMVRTVGRRMMRGPAMVLVSLACA